MAQADPSRSLSFAFRTALADGLVLAAAMAAATLQDPAFDLAAAVQHIFAKGLAVGYCAGFRIPAR